MKLADYEHPEAIEAALGRITPGFRLTFQVSTASGTCFTASVKAAYEWEPGTPAQRGKTNVFIMDWSDHPEKTQAWYKEREERAIDEGLLHIFRQEVDRNYAASVEGVVIPAEWVKSAIDVT